MTKTIEVDELLDLVSPEPSVGAQFVRALDRYMAAKSAKGYADPETRIAKREVDRLRAEIAEGTT
jgi:hypothetical protein